MIEVRKLGNETFEVVVRKSETTTHRVTLSPAYHAKLSAGRVSPERLIERSFEFLLERESNTSILRAFDLPVIGRYFPEYEGTIQSMLTGQG
jgi:hypothetical protein